MDKLSATEVGASATLHASMLFSVDLRRLQPGLVTETGHLDKDPDAGAQMNAANLKAQYDRTRADRRPG